MLVTSAAFAVGDAEAGRAKAATCIACHGADGNSTSPLNPKIAGQPAAYIVSTLRAYQTGKRNHPAMLGMVQTLNEQDMLDVAAYYEQFSFSGSGISSSELESANRGREIYRGGQTQYAVPACMACHGPAGDGIPARYPKVSGQFKEYLIHTLTEYKNGTRQSDEMNPIAFRLSLQQIEDLATYMQGLD